MSVVDHKDDKDRIAQEHGLHHEDASIGAAVHVTEEDVSLPDIYSMFHY